MAGTSKVPELPVLDLSLANGEHHDVLLRQLRTALFDIGFLYIKNHGVPQETISRLVSLLPPLFAQPPKVKASLSKRNSPHFLGYSGYAEETTLGLKDLREQFDLATELPVIWKQAPNSHDGNGVQNTKRDLTRLYWRLRGPNQWPPEDRVPGFREAVMEWARSFRLGKEMRANKL